MNEDPQHELQHLSSASALATPQRSGLLGRARRDAADAASNPHYQEAVVAYQAGDLALAAACFRLAAAQSHAESQYMLSTLLDASESSPQSAAEAAHWEQKAAEQGHAYAQANLSYRYYTAGDFAEAFAWCQRAAHSKLPWAQYHLGLMYRKGEGIDRSDGEAARWYRLAAEQNLPEAQQRLADLYFFGQGVTQSHKQAAVWYRKAAVQGNAEAQFQLGHLYATGQGVDPDYVQSRHWTRQAALQGHEQALRELKRREYRDP